MKVITALVCIGGSSVALADVIDFSDLAHGDVVAEQYAGMGVHISAVNPNRPHDIAMAFDTTLDGTRDPDLEDPWSMGNTDLSTNLGNVLIIQENASGGPDDEGSRPAGELIFDFDFVAQSFGFTVVDLESSVLEDTSVDFYLGGVLVSSVSFAEFEAGGTHDNGAIYGNNSINSIDEFGVDGGFDRAVLNVGGSMAFDNISFTVPTPTTLTLLGMGGLVAARRRR